MSVGGRVAFVGRLRTSKNESSAEVASIRHRSRCTANTARERTTDVATGLLPHEQAHKRTSHRMVEARARPVVAITAASDRWGKRGAEQACGCSCAQVYGRAGLYTRRLGCSSPDLPSSQPASSAVRFLFFFILSRTFRLLLDSTNATPISDSSSVVKV